MNKHKVVRAKSKLFLITVAQFDAIYWLKYLNYHHQQSLMSSLSLMEPETKVYDSRRETIDRVIVTRIRKSLYSHLQAHRFSQRHLNQSLLLAIIIKTVTRFILFASETSFVYTSKNTKRDCLLGNVALVTEDGENAQGHFY